VIRFLSVHRLAVIDQLELELGPGMSVLTGETGAGKSILVEAVGLLLGGRASADLVRSGEETAIVQAVLDTPSGNELIVRREVSAQGRSRAALGSLVDLHGQHEHQALLDPGMQLALLDRYAGLDGDRVSLAAAHARLVEARDALARFEASRRTRAERLDMLEFQRHEIEKVSPQAGEDDALEAEKTVVANAEKLARLAGEAYAALYDDDHAAMTSLAVVWKRLGELAALDSRFQPILDARASVMAPLDDAARTLRDYADSIDRSPERLQVIEDRLAALARLKRRYGPALADVIAKAQAIAEELEALGGGDEAMVALEQDAVAARRAYRTAADAMAAARRTAAPRLAKALEKALAELAMAGTRCQFALHAIEAEGEWGPTGADRLDLLLSPNVGEDLRPLGRIASGGELSRVMLAMKSLASTDVPGKTLIFDEVDAGIGGAVADVVGARLHALSSGCQVLCITHLPQVAAFGDEHYRVSKKAADGRTVTRVERLDEDARETEVARMMGGQAVSAGVRAGARDLLAAQARRKAKVGQKAKGESRRL
jgi:DNA repair protein RecN (Recombination protein N)